MNPKMEEKSQDTAICRKVPSAHIIQNQMSLKMWLLKCPPKLFFCGFTLIFIEMFQFCQTWRFFFLTSCGTFERFFSFTREVRPIVQIDFQITT